jgi:hypothetical protein
MHISGCFFHDSSFASNEKAHIELLPSQVGSCSVLVPYHHPLCNEQRSSTGRCVVRNEIKLECECARDRIGNTIHSYLPTDRQTDMRYAKFDL